MSITQNTNQSEPTAHIYAERSAAFQAELARQVPAEMMAHLNAEIAATVRSNPGAQALRAGSTAPTFTLPDVHGNQVSLATLLRNGPVVVAFYRGDWCPYCDLQLKAYQEILPRIRAAGASLVALSPQTPKYCNTTAEKRSLDFPLLSDASNKVAHSYGLVFKVSDGMLALLRGFGIELSEYNGEPSAELPVPGAFVVARDGRIDFEYVNPDYRERLEPAAILRRLEQLKTSR
jgi:peroxiredoxin